MTSVYDFHLPNFTYEIIHLITFPKFLSFVYVTSKLNILSNHIKHPKRLTLYYTLSFFTILKFPYLISQLTYLENDFSLRKKLSYTKKLGF